MSTFETVQALGDVYASITPPAATEAVCQDMTGFDKAVYAFEGLGIAVGAGMLVSKTIIAWLKNPGHQSAASKDYHNERSTIPRGRSSLFDEPGRYSSETISSAGSWATLGRGRRRAEREARNMERARAIRNGCDLPPENSFDNKNNYAQRRTYLYGVVGSLSTAAGFGYYVHNTGCNPFF